MLFFLYRYNFLLLFFIFLIFFCRHGLVRTEHYILNDPDLSFQKIIRKLLVGESLSTPTKVKKEPEQETKTSSGGMKLERPEDILRMDKGEILVKLEKGEGTLRIEKLGMKSELDASAVKTEKEDVKLSVVKSEPKEESDKTKRKLDEVDADLKLNDVKKVESQPKDEASDLSVKVGEKAQEKDGPTADKLNYVEDLSKAPSDATDNDNEKKTTEEQDNSKSNCSEETAKRTDDSKTDDMEVETNIDKDVIKAQTPSVETSITEDKSKESSDEKSSSPDEKPLDTAENSAAEKATNVVEPDVEMAVVENEVKSTEEMETTVDQTKIDDFAEKTDKAPEPEEKSDSGETDVKLKTDSVGDELEIQRKEEASKGVVVKDKVKEESCLDMTVTEKECEKESPKETRTTEDAESRPTKDTKTDSSLQKREDAVIARDRKDTKEKVKSSAENSDVKIEKELSGKVKSDLQALYPDLEVVHPLSRLPEIDTFVFQDQQRSSSQSPFGQHSFNPQSSSYNQQSFSQIQQSLQGMNSAQALQQLQNMDKLDPSVSQLLAQSFQSQIKWPKDMALEARLQHVVHCVEKGEWPVSRNFSVFTTVPQLPVVLPPGVTATIPNNHGSGIDVDLSYLDSVSNDRRDGASTPYSDSSDVITITTDNGSLSSQYPQFMRKRKRHIAIDVETERAKLHALLNSTNSSNQHQSSQMGYRSDRDRFDRHDRQDRNERQYDRQYDRQQLDRQQLERRQYKELERHQLLERQQQLERASQLLEKSDRRQPVPQPKQSPVAWDDESPSEDSRRSTPAHQPPPAHQHGPRVISMPYDLGKFTMPSKPKPTPPPAASPAPSPSSSSGAIDLSGGPPKSKTPSEDSFGMGGEDEAQDFSMGKKRKSSKLDDMLGKLMQKKNVPVPTDEPVQGKEMKRRKLDEIVMGLSAAKEQQYPDPMLKRRSPTPMIPPGVTVTPASSSSSRTPTPTHSSSGSSSKPPFSITVTSVQHPPPPSTPGSSRNASGSSSSSSNLAKDTYSSYLQQAEQHNLLLKQVRACSVPFTFTCEFSPFLCILKITLSSLTASVATTNTSTTKASAVYYIKFGSKENL